MAEERRVVTVMFADIVGSTAMGEASDPEDVRALQSTYSRIAREILSSHGGTVEKFIGDAVMAVFGVPHAHDDDPDRALTAALALRDGLARDPATMALSLRIGVNSGEVVAVRDAASEMLVSGDTVNVAARIQQAAAPGEILVGERTIAATRRRSTFGDVRPLEVKGRRDPVTAAPLLALEVGITRSEEPPFVDRDADLAQLSLIAMRAFTEARPQLVTISAPAGTGKSRLVSVFTSKVRALRPNLRVATAQAIGYGAGTYLPMRPLLASLMRVKEQDLGVASIRDALVERGSPAADAERFAGLVAGTLGLASPIAGHDREEFFAAWRSCVERLAIDAPTILVLEDLHLAAESLLDLIEHVTQLRGRAPLLIVALTRPELFDRRTTWGTARRNATSITLDPLAPAETKEVLRAVMPEALPLIVDRLAERAEGNPFFAVELARSLRERGEGATLPDTVQATVLARLDLLPQAERRTLQTGSVIGRSFTRHALEHVAGADAVAALDALADRDLLVPRPDATYSFRHIVIREVAYGTLPRTERARVHLELARWLAGLADTPAEVVAYHYRQALTLSARSLSHDDLAHAIRALEVAAGSASRTGADREAVALLTAAIQCAPADGQVRLHERLGDALGITDEAADAYAAAFARWKAIDGGDPRVGARLLRKRALVYARWGGTIRRPLPARELRALSAEARELLARRPDRVESARLDVLDVFFAGQPAIRDEIGADQLPSRDQALALGEAARRTLAAAGDRDAESEALDALAAVARTSGMTERSIGHSRERMRIPGLSLLERSDAVAMVCNSLAFLGDFDGVLDTFAGHLAALKPGEPDGFYAYPHIWAEWAARLSGRWDDALRIGDRVAEIVETREGSGTAPVSGLSLALAGYVARARLDHARSERYGAAAAAILEGMPQDPFLYVAAYRLVFRDEVSNALQQLAGPRAALTSIEMLMVLLLDHDVLADEATVANVEARTHVPAAMSQERTALIRAVRSGPPALRGAIAALEKAGLRADAARARGVLARMTGDAGDRAAAEQRLRALGDHAYLARLDEPFEPRSG